MSDGDSAIGRPTESRDGARRDQVIYVRVSPLEHDWIREQAAEAGAGLAEWVRRKALRGMPRG